MITSTLTLLLQKTPCAGKRLSDESGGGDNRDGIGAGIILIGRGNNQTNLLFFQIISVCVQRWPRWIRLRHGYQSPKWSWIPMTQARLPGINPPVWGKNIYTICFRNTEQMNSSRYYFMKKHAKFLFLLPWNDSLVTIKPNGQEKFAIHSHTLINHLARQHQQQQHSIQIRKLYFRYGFNPWSTASILPSPKL